MVRNTKRSKLRMRTGIKTFKLHNITIISKISEVSIKLSKENSSIWFFIWEKVLSEGLTKHA